MIGTLPKSIAIGGVDYAIRSDFRVILNIFEAINDKELTENEKIYICLKCFYEEFDSIPERDYQEAIDKAFWFCDGGDMPQSKQEKQKIFDWKQDESIIFPAVNKIAGKETRDCEYMHWWSFLGLFSEIGEGRLSVIISIRQKRAKGKPLDKWEREYYMNNKEIIELTSPEDAEDLKEDEAFLKELLGGKA